MKQTMEEDFLQKIKVSSITADDIIDIQSKTKLQSSSKLWKEQRQYRITSSTFGTICKATERRDIEKLLNSLFGDTEFTSLATNHGKKYENVAVRKFEAETGKTSDSCGIFVSIERPMLAASPDRILNSNAVIEVKCPFSARQLKITPKSVPYLYIKNTGELSLKETHDYYYQIQGQLYCTERKLCKFVVYTLKDMKIIDVNYDQEFINSMLLKLDDFYVKFFKPALIERFFYHCESKYNF
ncbi:uncharacterized protein LOC141900803 [Tubulanus polymorphus]|uniref:uncharacterized protein LOC141900803 n=1 Tax=Tubulanus polymorphus TaxID=672921 RepID=UPI003DA26BDF